MVAAYSRPLGTVLARVPSHRTRSVTHGETLLDLDSRTVAASAASRRSSLFVFIFATAFWPSDDVGRPGGAAGRTGAPKLSSSAMSGFLLH